jgi:glycine/D-amino acid oxidase-like deaminating enzyme
MSQNHWHANAVEWIKFSNLIRDITVDVAVVGAGFTGLSTALYAAKSGAKVAVIDAKHVGFGGSGRNVGLVNAGLWLPPDQVEATLGIEIGARLIDRLSRAPKDVFDLIKTYYIQCDAHQNGTIHLAHSKDGLNDLKNRHKQWSSRNVKTEILDPDEIQRRTASNCYFGGLFDPRAGVVQPFDYVRGLARAATQHGAAIYENTPLTGAIQRNGEWRLTTPSGTITSKHVVFATNAYGPINTVKTVPATSYVYYFQAVSDQIPDTVAQDILSNNEGCWDTAMIMSSFRMTRDNRLVFGAMGNSDGAHGGIHERWARRALKRIFPQLSDVKLGSFWSGRIAMTTTKIPKLIVNDTAISVFGYSGRGIAPGTAMGKDIAAYIVSGDTSALNLPIEQSYREGFTTAKSAYYEAGASLIHSLT